MEALVRDGLRELSTSSSRLVGAEAAADDLDTGLRPRRLAEFIGQAQLRENLAVFIEAARSRNEALDHLLFAGPPGLGKTTLAQIVAAELGVGFRMTSGPIIARAGDLAAILTNLQPRDVLFIDEIHRLIPVIEEVLYPAMEEFQLDLMIGEGPAARSVRIDLPPFTLIGATTRTGLLTTPLRDRFGIHARLDFYAVEELLAIVPARRRLLRLRSRRGRCRRDRPPGARHAPGRDPPAAPRARLRDGRRPGRGRCARLADRALPPPRGRRARPRSPRPALPRAASPRAMAAGRSAIETSRRRSPSSATRSRRWSSPSCFSRACCSARRAGVS